jgi:hypothetical protein
MIGGVVELKVGHRASGAANRFAVHAANIANQRPGGRKDGQNILPLIGNLWPLDLHKAGIVRAGLQTHLAQPASLELGRTSRSGRRLLCLSKAFNGGVFI